MALGGRARIDGWAVVATAAGSGSEREQGERRPGDAHFHHSIDRWKSTFVADGMDVSSIKGLSRYRVNRFPFSGGRAVFGRSGRVARTSPGGDGGN